MGAANFGLFFRRLHRVVLHCAEFDNVVILFCPAESCSAIALVLHLEIFFNLLVAYIPRGVKSLKLYFLLGHFHHRAMHTTEAYVMTGNRQV